MPVASPLADRSMLPLLAAGILGLLLAPDATPAIAPRAAVGWALAATGVAALFLRSRVVHAAAAVVFALAAEHLLFSPGLPHGHDLLSHAWGVWAFFQNMASGETAPVWLHHVSLGLPLPLFYSPAPYYSLTPFYWAGLPAVTILKGGFVAFAVAGVLAMYFVARQWTGSSRAGLVAAAAYAFAPYRLLTGHYRQAFGESAALAILPLVFWLFFGPGGWSRRRLAAAAVSTAALILIHPLSVLTAGVVGAIWQAVELLLEGAGSGGRRRCAMRIGAALLGVVLSGFYVVPLAARLGSVSVDESAVLDATTGEARLARQGLRLSQPLRRLPWTHLARSEPRGAPRDADGEEVPHYFGWGLFACTLLAGALGLRQRLRDAAAVAGATVALVAVAALALTLHLSAAALAHLPLLPKLQFAWRFLGPATLAAALAAGFVARALISARRAPYAALLAALLVADAFPFTGAPDWAPAYEGFAHFYRQDACGGRWGCWEAEQVARPLPLRVYGHFLPPSDFADDVAHVKPGYGEYLNPRSLRRVRAAARDDRWEGLGVGLEAGTGRGVTVLDAAPYAQWLAPGSSRPLPLEFQRRAGSIDVALPAAAGTLVVLEQHFPGWEAAVDGEGALVEPTEDGFLQVPVVRAASHARLAFRLRGPDVLAGRAATLAALAVCLWMAWRPSPRRRTALLSLVLVFTVGCAAPDGSKRPNILLVVADTLRYDRLTSYGYHRETSPAIDREIARKGVVLETAYSQSPWTLPSMVSLMTSRHPGELLGDDPTTFGLPPEVATLPERLQGLGYRTAGFVANALLRPGNGFARGFETFDSPPRQRDDRSNAENLTARARDWLRVNSGETFFLYLHFMDPHDPYGNADVVDGRSPFFPDYQGRLLEQSFDDFLAQERKRDDPTTGVPAQDVAHWSALYDSEVRYMDRALGELLESIPPDVLRRTLVVFTADHGEELHDHGWWLHARTVFEELVHVPLLVRWDGVIPAGRRIAGTVRLLDLMPTLVAAAGGEPSPEWQGVDLLPVLRDGRPLPRLPAFADAFTKNRPLRAGVVLDGFKLAVFNRNEPLTDPRPDEAAVNEVDRRRLPLAALYDLARDPRERHNLLERDPTGGGRRERMERLLHGQLDRQLAGLRVIADALPVGQRLGGALQLDRAPEGWLPYFLEDEDRVEADGAELRFELTGGVLAKGFIVLGDPGVVRHVEAWIGDTSLDDSAIRLANRPWSAAPTPVAALELPAWPEEPDGPSLLLWYRDPRRTPLAEDDETRRRLEALGYL